MRVRWGIVALLILIGISSAYGLKNGKATIAIRQTGAKPEDIPEVRVGERLALELYLDAQGERMTGCAVYLSFDKEVFGIPEGSSTRPFEQGNFFKGRGGVSKNEACDLSDSEIGLAYAELTGVAVGGVRPYASGTGVLARFSLLVLRQSAEAAEIRIDMVPNRRATLYFVVGSDVEYNFRSRTGLKMQIVGFAISPPFPDVHLLPGDSTRVLLDDHVDDFKTPDEDILWSVQGSEHVTARLDEETRSVILRAEEGWKGQEQVLFEAQNSDSLVAMGSMLVTVGYPPEITEFELSFEEDSRLGIRLSDHATDRDTPLSDLVWTAGDGEFITADVQDDSLWVYAPDDWYGEDEVYVLVADEYGLNDSLAVRVVVSPVNDPPVVEDLPDVELIGTKPFTILLDSYVFDIDNRDEEIRWTYNGGDTVTVLVDEGRRATFTVPAGWTGSETISFVAFDPDSLSDSTTVHVSAVLAPPILALPDLFFFFSGEGRVSADLHGEEEFVLDRYVSDEDDSLSALRWMVEGNAELTVDIDSVSHVLSMDAPADFRGQETLIFTVTDPAGHSARDTSSVIVLYDGEPTVTKLPDVVLSVGETSAPIPLNDYVWDRDTPDSLITWSSSGNTYVSVSIDTLSKLTFFAEDTLWAGSEIITLIATDPEGHTGRDTVKVTVTAESFGPLQFTIALLRNPILIRHVDFYVVASNPLGEGPTILVSGTPLDLAEMDPLRRIFRGGYDLESSDTLLSVEVWGKDVWGNEGTGGRTFSAQFVRASTGGTVTSPDETWAVHFPGGALWSDQWVFLYQAQGTRDEGRGTRKIFPYQDEMTPRFRISDFGFRIENPAIPNPQSARVYVLDASDKAFREPVELSIEYDAVRNEEALGVFRWDEREAEWCYVPTYVDRAGRRAVAAVPKPGVYRLQRAVLQNVEKLPSRLRLLPNRPNPFNAETCMVYELPRSGPVSVKVFNLRGQLIRRVMEGHQCAGRHLVRWDGRDGEGRETGSGVYIYRVEFDGYGDAGKMVKVE